jgi:FixJ family two-component response regulator
VVLAQCWKQATSEKGMRWNGHVMQAGASGFFIKPLDNEKFIAAVQDALEQA